METSWKYVDLPPVWLLGFCAIIWLSGSTPLGVIEVPLFWVGTVALGAGCALIAAAFVEFYRLKTTVVPHQSATSLITGGVFRLSRNPIYLADLLILAGVSLRGGAIWGLLLVPILMWILTTRFIKDEETRLARDFGPEFAAYCCQTRRWM